MLPEQLTASPTAVMSLPAYEILYRPYIFLGIDLLLVTFGERAWYYCFYCSKYFASNVMLLERRLTIKWKFEFVSKLEYIVHSIL